ncbi:MAG: ribosomal protein large subunit ribosomal protein [Candidatus Kaiserbacteria bacterium]|nr:ribosomal protein large subunit ribosomal protein [Candidatus Kaiserbacteria bacterium]
MKNKAKNTTQKDTFEALKGDLGITNIMQTPKLTKIVVTTGLGSLRDKKKEELIVDRLTRITGQKPVKRVAKKSIANFKVRTGDVMGYQVTLRGARMQSFFDKMVHVVFPRIKDFRGIKPSSIDEMGNISTGLKEHTVFPETSDEDARDVFGLAVNIGTSAKNSKDAEAFLRHMGVPLQK